jgi:tripartite-type tricarboxylate transporter receptor subunit TctC
MHMIRHFGLRMGRRAAILLLGSLLAGTGLAGARAENQPFYEGKQIRFIIAHAAGSPYDTFARIVIKHMGKHIPGHPVFVPQNMLGAVGITAMNALYNGMPRDGTVIGQAGKSAVLEPLYGNELAKFDALKLNWIGSGQSDVSLCFSRLDSQIKAIEDARDKVMLVGATGPTGDSSFISHLVNSFLGTKLKPILGYPDTPTVALAMERGELDGGCGYTSSTLRSARPDWFEQKKINIILQASLNRSKSFPDVPSVGDYVTSSSDREALKLAFSTDPLVRTFVAPPGVPADRIEILRKAFADTMKDPEFLHDAALAQFDVDALSGADVEERVKEIYATPKAALDRILAVRDLAASGAPSKK